MRDPKIISARRAVTKTIAGRTAHTSVTVLHDEGNTVLHFHRHVLSPAAEAEGMKCIGRVFNGHVVVCENFAIKLPTLLSFLKGMNVSDLGEDFYVPDNGRTPSA